MGKWRVKRMFGGDSSSGDEAPEVLAKPGAGQAGEPVGEEELEAIRAAFRLEMEQKQKPSAAEAPAAAALTTKVEPLVVDVDLLDDELKLPQPIADQYDLRRRTRKKKRPRADAKLEAAAAPAAAAPGSAAVVTLPDDFGTADIMTQAEDVVAQAVGRARRPAAAPAQRIAMPTSKAAAASKGAAPPWPSQPAKLKPEPEAQPVSGNVVAEARLEKRTRKIEAASSLHGMLADNLATSDPYLMAPAVGTSMAAFDKAEVVQLPAGAAQAPGGGARVLPEGSAGKRKRRKKVHGEVLAQIADADPYLTV